MRFASHRDVARAIERGVRVAGVPVAYSAGFTPHPKISYSGGAPTGSASEAEFLEISLARRCEPADVGQRLDAALPDGIDVIDVVEADGKFAATLEASEWEVIWPGVAPDAAATAVQAFLEASCVEVERLTSKGLRRLDARAAVVDLTVGVHAGRRGEPGSAAGCAILRMIVRQMTPAVRPDDLLTALRAYPGLAPAGPAMITRLWQGPLGSASEPGPDRRGQGHGTDTHGTDTAVLVTGQADDLARHAGRPRNEPQSQAVPAQDSPAQDTHVQDQHVHGTHGQDTHAQDRHAHDKTVRPTAGSAMSAPAEQARVDEQLPRGAHDQLAGPRAREPYGRDFPHARDRATERTTRAR